MQKGRYYIDQELVGKIAQRIKELRNEHGHTQEYLIEQVHLSINSYEVGHKVPTLMSILKICEFYGFFRPDKLSSEKITDTPKAERQIFLPYLL